MEKGVKKPSHTKPICKGSTADPQILWRKLHTHADFRFGTGVYILSIGMCCGMPGVQSHHYDRL